MAPSPLFTVGIGKRTRSPTAMVTAMITTNTYCVSCSTVTMGNNSLDEVSKVSNIALICL